MKDASLNLAITRACNHTCGHCYVDSTLKGPPVGKMALEDWTSVLEQAAELGFRHVHVFGGEPFLHPQLREVCEEAVARGLEYNMATNGSLVTDEDLDWLQATGGSLVLNVHGLAAHHDEFCGNRGSFARLVELVPRLLERDVDAAVATCVTRSNVGQFIEVVRTFARLGVRSFFALHFSPLGRGGNLLEEMIPPGNWWRLYGALRGELADLRRSYGRNVEIYFELATYPTEDRSVLLQTQEVSPCPLPHRPNFVVDWDGRVFPCILFLNDPNWVLGDASREPLAEVLGELNISWVRERLRFDCRGCRNYFRCQGGCLAYSLGASRDFRCAGDGSSAKFLPFCPLRTVQV
ncbi:MAG: radical SAM protein [Promethearchaeota archaeon]